MIESGARVVSPLLHDGEHDVVYELIGVADLDDVLEGEIGDVMEEGQDLIEEEIVVILSALGQLCWLDCLAAIDKIAFRNNIIDGGTPDCISAIANIRNFLTESLVEDITHFAAEVVVIEDP